jgi:hypothetical protein
MSRPFPAFNPRASLVGLMCAVFALTPGHLRAQQGIPVVDLPAPSAKSTQTFGAVLGVRQISGGKVLVDDAGQRQIRLLDSTLATSTLVLDSTPGASNSYGGRPVPLVPYLGDSSLFADLKSRTVLVLDSKGQIARTLALPSQMSAGELLSPSTGVDNKGRIIYVSLRRGMPILTPRGVGFADSVPIIRADLDLRRVDTIARVSRPIARATAPTKAPNGTTYTMFAVDPLKTIDEWSVLSDGSVAIVRGQDYHIDWIRPDGTVSSTPKMPFDWKRLTDDDKQRLIDSTRAAQNALLASDKLESDVTMMTRGDMSEPPPGAGDANRGGRGAGRGDGGGRGGDDGGNALSENGRGYLPRVSEVIPLNQIADYYPPIRLGATIPDLDGHLWILPTTSTQSKRGELVYDVVNTKGELFRRVRAPLGRLVVGFGKGGIVYLTSGDRTNGFYLERTKLP